MMATEATSGNFADATNTAETEQVWPPADLSRSLRSY
jgi:hypothetical protein